MSVTSSSISGGIAQAVSSSSVSAPADFDEASIVYKLPLQGSLNAPGFTNPTFTRSTVGKVSTTASAVKEFGVDEGRFTSFGLRLEQNATNNLVNNADLSNPSWVPNNCTVSQDSTVAPDGSTTAWKIEATTDGKCSLVGLMPSLGQSAGLWVKEGNVTGSTFSLAENGAPVTLRYMDEPVLSPEWKRLEVNQSDFTPSGGVDLYALYPHTGGEAGTATAGDHFYAWSPDCQNRDLITGSIETGLTSVTRTVEECVIPSGFCPEPDSPFSFSFTLKSRGNPGAVQQVVRWIGETAARRINITAAGVIKLLYAGNVIDGTTDVTAGGVYRITFTADASNFKLFVNGVQEGPTTTIGASSGGAHTSIDLNDGNNCYLDIKNVIIRDKLLTDSEALQDYQIYA